jgi:hypothetical protein
VTFYWYKQINRVKARSHISQSEALFFSLSFYPSFCRRVNTTPEVKELRESGKQGGKSTQDAEKNQKTVIQSISNQDFRTLIIQTFKSSQLILISTAPPQQ